MRHREYNLKHDAVLKKLRYVAFYHVKLDKDMNMGKEYWLLRNNIRVTLRDREMSPRESNDCICFRG